ncbi:esterase-like activity of phytase family protein [Jannaschia sp. W003]|uniref:esterase-like activity of phytase family protein n=1 Tax=Jannaschia sp. W003 TaxID=2867012 RepID=UPI0021A352CD|nr:esterase-like activity of phytase family protein [Jannaschia sp. W003]UWQ22182.1 esterase-like activity of phytase family protein [Jannaschia sp. W003]
MRFRPLCALALGAALPACAADTVGSHVWEPDWARAGGYSALWLGEDGLDFVALSDRGSWVRGRLVRDAAGAVSAVAVAAHGPLLRSTGGPLKGGESDAEGLAKVGDTFYVSYEGVTRVMRHPTLEGVPERIPRHPDFERMQSNSGLEALAADAAGRLYAIPERSTAEDGAPLPVGETVPDVGGDGHPFPVYRYDPEDAVWDWAFSIPREGAFLVSGADFGPDGRLYVLERDFAVIGFRSRIRSFAADGTDGRVEMVSPLRAHDNLEGISIWRDARGRIRATMISDDNLRRTLQTTEFVDYVLSGPDGAATGADG